MSSGLSPNLDTKFNDPAGSEMLSIALIGPDENRRRAVAAALAECRAAKVREFSSYPTALDEVPRLLEQYFDVILIDLDSDPEFALDLVENICAKDAATVMVYSGRADQDMVVRCMRAGAREYLIPPYDQSNVGEALALAAAILRPRTRPAKRSLGRLLVFLGAKGGAGVTTIACNFAIALAQESGQSTVLIDLALPMGDAALNLGIAAEYSTDHALQDAERLDASFLLKLLAKHQSGVSVLAAPSKVPEVEPSKTAIDKLMSVARQEFDNVIVDVGSRIDLMGTALFREAYTVYLVTQAGISELRNANRLISRFFDAGGPKLEIIINRFEPSFLGVTEEVITKAISRPVRWKIPDDYDAARQMQNSSGAASLPDSSISRLILEMASSVTGHPISQEKRKGFSFKGLGKGSSEKAAAPDKSTAVLSAAAGPSAAPVGAGETAEVEWLTPDSISFSTPLSFDQLNATASVPGTFVYTPGPGYVLPPGTHTLWVTFNPSDSATGAPVQTSVSITVSKAVPAVAWDDPPDMPCGTPLSAAQLNATASVPGTFNYSPAAGEVLGPGTHTLSVAFTPTNSTNYATAQSTVSVCVMKMTPELTWPAPEPIHTGEPLGEAQLNATAAVPGTFEYYPAAGEKLSAGAHTLSVTFTPADEANYTSAQATMSLLVVKTTPVLAWPNPEPLTYGAALGEEQLNASASVPGTFVYTPAAGAMLAAGEHTPTVIFTPSNSYDFTPAQAAVSLTVNKALPAVTWPSPRPIPNGTPLSAAQLNAKAPIPGKFTYAPAAGEILAAGVHNLSVTFTPADAVNYVPVQTSVSLVVNELLPTQITWPTPYAIPYGTALGNAELNAHASAPGTLVYSPAAGDVLAPGKYALTVTFTPADSDKHAEAQASVELVVEALANINSLLAAGAHAPFTQGASGAGHGDREKAGSGSTGAAKTQRETRTYKGAIYEKGDDGQWHLQQK